MGAIRVCEWVDIPTAVPRRQYVCYWDSANRPEGYSGWSVSDTGTTSPVRPRRQPVTSKATSSGFSAYFPDPCISAIPAQPGSLPMPGTPPVPAQLLIDFNRGWTGRARSIASFPRAGYVEFTMTASVSGAVVGLNNEYRRNGYSDIKFAFYFSHGVVNIVERGTLVQSVGTYLPPTSFRIQRRGGEIRYYIGGVLVRTTPNETLPMHLDAALYSGGDTCDCPEIAAMDDISGGEGVLHGLVGIGSEGAYAQSIGALYPLVGEGRVGVRSAGTLHALSGIGGDYHYGVGIGSLRPLDGYGEGGLFVPSYAIGATSLVMLTGAATGLTGTIGGGEGSLARIIGLGGEGVYGESKGTLAPLIGYGDDYEGGNEAVISQALLVGAGAISQIELFVVMNERLEVEAVFAANLIYDATVSEEMEIDDSVLATALLNAFIFTTISANTVQPFDSGNHKVWVVNTDTLANSQYDNFGFNSFAKIGDSYYGAKEDGVYLLAGDDDDGEPIQTLLGFGVQEFGTQALKEVEHCYLGVASTGRLFLRVLVEGQEYLYAANTSSEDMRTHRVDIGKGLKANFLEFELYNSDGDDFELASVEFLVTSLRRRV